MVARVSLEQMYGTPVRLDPISHILCNFSVFFHFLIILVNTELKINLWKQPFSWSIFMFGHFLRTLAPFWGLWLLLITLAPFDHFGPFWSLWPLLITLAPSDPFGPFWSLWPLLITSGPGYLASSAPCSWRLKMSKVFDVTGHDL